MKVKYKLMKVKCGHEFVSKVGNQNSLTFKAFNFLHKS